jgi:carbon storage regulator
MRVLTRRRGERILVPQCELAVTVVAIEGNAVRLGFSAPTEIGVYREEVWRQNCPQTHNFLAEEEAIPERIEVAGQENQPRRQS